MLQGVNIDQVRQYNNSLKEYRDKAAKIQAAIEFNEKELERLCQELTTTLGVVVTVDNIEQIRDEYISKINNTLTTGMDIINRIKSEEEMMNSAMSDTVLNNSVTNNEMANNAGVASTTQQYSSPSQSQTNQTPIFASISDIPPIFGQV